MIMKNSFELVQETLTNIISALHGGKNKCTGIYNRAEISGHVY